ncbi:MAG: (2Fe-2S) ferredoxin domain-containing protein [Gomphosphaeria aponina SAG 52.96 = DSM 107014]|uniref:(2Fe-2S) ferredoxin domain-containing protein n=1 Tax=Gomphosphaeria aponina SAG 52.96 = DSM 107014 TaxID=1521640 RepID=A0A941GVX8_9CHRO|nr:(2Fe-2S) ferredoxin domain-containing protein [Gomphosphaeria aponina SAG 52.96 = DSM 107014]
MSNLKELVSEFTVGAQLLGFVIKEGDKIKYLRVAVSNQEYWIKPAKEIRDRLNPKIVPGCWLKISGIRKLELKKGKLKLTAYSVELANGEKSAQPTVKVLQEATAKPNKSKACILVCQKSTCWQRGGREICQKLEENIRDRGLEAEVEIKTIGCLKQCKYGPNLVMMPDKSRYSHVQPQQVPELLEKHFLLATTV